MTARAAAALCGFVFTLLCGAACAGAIPAPPPRKEPIRPSSDEGTKYFPLQHDTVLSFETLDEVSGEAGVLVMQIQRPRAGRADLRIGSKVQRLNVQADGVAHVTGGYVLKVPAALGDRWPGKLGPVAVTGVDQTATVPAGHFTDCLETTETSETSAQSTRIVSVYCAHVGLVSLVVESEEATGVRRERARLKSFGPRVDLEAATDPRPAE
jgi:hypothetical protein